MRKKRKIKLKLIEKNNNLKWKRKRIKKNEINYFNQMKIKTIFGK